MAWPKGKKRFASSSHNGRLMIVLRNRHTIWIDADPETGKKYLEQLNQAMSDPSNAAWWVTGSGGADVIRCEDIVHVKYQPPKSASESEPEPKAKPS